MFCMSLNREANRKQFRRNESAYLDVFADGRGFSVARQLRLQGFNGVIEVIGDLLPDQFPMAVASGIDAILIHAEGCDQEQWRQKSTDKKTLWLLAFSSRRLIS